MRRAARNISTQRLLTEEEQRQVSAAIRLAGLSRKAFTEQAEISYSTLSKSLARNRVPTEAVAGAIEKLLKNTRWPELPPGT